MTLHNTRQESHAEQATGEVFLGYYNQAQFDTLAWETKRKGQIVFADDGGVVGQSGTFIERRLFPVFISRSEREQKRRQESMPFYQHA